MLYLNGRNKPDTCFLTAMYRTPANSRPLSLSLIVCFKPRALHVVTNATMEARSCFELQQRAHSPSRLGGTAGSFKSNLPAMRVVVD